MKRVFITFLLVSLLSTAVPIFAQSPPTSDRNLILTEGMAEVKGQNDSGKISIAVVTEGRNLEQVSSENASKTKAVLTAIKGLNIRGLKLETSNYQVTPMKDYKARPPSIKGYEVRNEIEATLEEFEPEYLSKNVSKIVVKALESGANHIHHIQFYIKNKELLEKEALTKATQEAISRARTMAEAAGVKLKRIASLSTHPVHVPPSAYTFRGADMKAESVAAEPPIEAGESQIRVQVSLAYEIE